MVRGQERPEHPQPDRSHRRTAAGDPARLPIGPRRRSTRPQGRTVRFHDELRTGVVLRPGRRREQIIQDLAHRLGDAGRRMAARRSPPRGLSSTHSACMANAAAAYNSNWACWPTTCCVRGISAGRTRRPAAGGGPLAAGHRSGRHGRRRPLCSGGCSTTSGLSRAGTDELPASVS